MHKIIFTTGQIDTDDQPINVTTAKVDLMMLVENIGGWGLGRTVWLSTTPGLLSTLCSYTMNADWLEEIPPEHWHTKRAKALKAFF